MFVLNVFFVLTTLICGIRSQGEATNSMTTHLDIAFIMDTTGSMGPYIETARNNIKRVVQEITEISESHIRFALIEYRDHKPEENTYVYRKLRLYAVVTTNASWLENQKQTAVVIYPRLLLLHCTRGVHCHGTTLQSRLLS
ncbi:hypothetical protein DPMN_182951 [Dreissena polymorpha]|uniref:VWFA domain-containing protein n=1 Tax=Dreissena polymorpha TaxID=45954 RepID=A0A9D4DHJ2_DREPO|nr:hypothetical protein DPMN_182951 [Dreissena polymorpha]